MGSIVHSSKQLKQLAFSILLIFSRQISLFWFLQSHLCQWILAVLMARKCCRCEHTAGIQFAEASMGCLSRRSVLGKESVAVRVLLMVHINGTCLLRASWDGSLDPSIWPPSHIWAYALPKSHHVQLVCSSFSWVEPSVLATLLLCLFYK